ncbi:hypothetical protein O9992_27515 [Vibrio lentus]|nr:hypothetical protein [Vibrio lentus]
MGYEDWSFITSFGLRTIDSNIDFTILEQVLASVGVDLISFNALHIAEALARTWVLPLSLLVVISSTYRL